ncbi:sensor domain-containing protein [Streptomyces sp. ACA25]|uniref:sensor histidine kinase n=1 Tax=Streptomyces sp. ACA25 TaxID=3022596 RepID=UPI0023079EED|nr:sensor histidine kinase [Streptomyces sp. ACA25]MDB1090362.1 sensor domain-containing protein [Streptomyces sp. ACA25]
MTSRPPNAVHPGDDAPAACDAPLPPPRAALGAATWRELGYLLTSWPVDVAVFTAVLSWLATGAVLAVTVVGLPVLALGLAGCRELARYERWRARVLLGLRVEEPSPLPRPRGSGAVTWVWSGLKDPVGWRTVLFCLVRPAWSLAAFVLTVVALFVAWPLLPWLARGLSHVDRALVRALLSPSDGLERRIAELESDRSVVLDTSAADLRRIERDLHDGAQARLVALAMDLGLAKEKLTQDPRAAARLVDEAHGEAKLVLQELRDLARGIHPAILTDRGLGPALSATAARCTVPVQVTVDLPTRPAPAIEGITYFTASELLQNISKHSGATTATLDIWHTDDRLLLQITDNGHGGADPTNGTGLTGLTERLAAVDGLLSLTSPPGGPTTLTAALPWHPRTGSPERQP